MRNIRAINFGGKDIPEGITTYLEKQIKFLEANVGMFSNCIGMMFVANPPKGEEKYWHLVGMMMLQLRGIVDG